MKNETKLPNTESSIFSVMTALANEAKAINISQGFPDFNPDPHLMNLVHQAMHNGHNQYAPMPGVAALRQQIASKIQALYGASIDPEEEITITAGATQAIYTAISAFVRPGSEVIVLEPAYDCYVPAILVNGGVPVYVQLRGPDFTVDWAEVREKINPSTVAILINSPHNPTGALWEEADWMELQKIAIEEDLIVVSDEVYEHIVFDGKKHQTMMQYPELMKRGFSVFSFGKVFHNTGWKMGYAVGDATLMSEFRKIHQFLVFSCNTPVQYALAEYLKDEENYLSLNDFFERKRDLLIDELSGSAFSFKPASGTYFQLIHFRDFSDLHDLDFCRVLARTHGVATIPMSAFYHDKLDEGYVRLCFAKTDEVIRSAAKRISAAG